MNKRFIHIILITFTLVSCTNTDLEKDFLNSYLVNFKEENNISKLYIGLDNSNVEIINTINQQIFSNSYNNDNILSKIFINSKLENFQKQISSKSIWNIDFPIIENVFLSKKQEEINLYITKPVFSLNKKYALIYNYKKSNKGIYMIPPIEVFELKNKEWKKIKEIRHFQ